MHGPAGQHVDDHLRPLRPGRRGVLAAGARRARGRPRRRRPGRRCCAGPRRACPRCPSWTCVRHYVRLSALNFSIDTAFYPLGLVHDEAQPEGQRAGGGHARLRPAAPASRTTTRRRGRSRSCGACERLPGVDRRPAARHAAAGGRRAGRAARPAAHARPTTSRRAATGATVIIPDTAHGTNPASVTMAGYDTVTVQTDARGGVDLDDLRAKRRRGRRRPHAHEPQHARAVRREHRRDRRARPRGRRRCSTTTAPTSTPSWASSRPGDMGFDIVHFNTAQDLLHAARRRRPGRRPGGGAERARAVPARARSLRRDGDGDLGSSTTGRSRSASCRRFVRQRRRAGAGLRLHPRPRARRACARSAETAVLNANYLLARLRGAYDVPFDRCCKHEFVLSARRLKRRARRAGPRRGQAADGLRLPPADDLLPADRGRGPHGRADGDGDAGGARRLRGRHAGHRARGRGGREVLRTAPHTTLVGRLDEVRAVKQPVLRSEQVISRT